MLYPLKFNPVYKDYMWGGTSLRDVYGRSVPYDIAAESWEISCHNNGMSIISNGELSGTSLQKIFENHKIDLLGNKAADYKKFPLLIKIIDAKERLSLQVHPEDLYAGIHENGELGKNEMWYVLKAGEASKLTIGLKKGVTKELFREGLIKGEIEGMINEIPVKAGDVVDIPAGLIHAIEEDIMIVEVQQNSDTTYRVSDWNRVGLDGKPREIHVEKALDVIDFDSKIPIGKIEGVSTQIGKNRVTSYISNDYFIIDKLDITGTMTETTKKAHAIIYICMDGNVSIRWQGTETSVVEGESILIPACLGDYDLVGDAKLLKAIPK